MLTLKQERYVQELVKGKSQREAYKAAYDASRMLDKTIDNRAYVLFKKSEIRARYDELMASAVNKTADDAVSMRAFIIETYKRIASGDLCEESTEEDAEGKTIRKRKTVKPSDVNNAIAKLAEYYGVAPAPSENNEIVIKLDGDLKVYGD